MIGLSVDAVESHLKWEKDIEETQGYAVTYPMIGDSNLEIAKLYGMLPADELTLQKVEQQLLIIQYVLFLWWGPIKKSGCT